MPIEIKLAKKYLKKYSISLAIREMTIKTALKLHLTLLKMAKVRGEKANVGKDVRRWKPSFTAGGIAILYGHYGNHSGGF